MMKNYEEDKWTIVCVCASAYINLEIKIYNHN